MGATRACQGETLALRAPPSVDLKEGQQIHNTLFFADGGCKALAGFVVLLDAAALAVSTDTADELFQDPNVVAMVLSLLRIPTVWPQSGAGTHVDSRIASIAKQNVDSRVAPVSSYQWACIFRGLCEPGLTIQLADVVDLYNNHPDIVASRASSMNDLGDNGGGLMLDSKKMRCIKHWLECSDPRVFDIVEKHQHSVPWRESAFSEKIIELPFLFLGSQMPAGSTSADALTPLQGEAFITLDWALPMTGDAQVVIFSRIVAEYERTTATVPTHQRKKYRKTSAELQELRNICALWCQVRSFLELHLTMPEVEEKYHSLINGQTMDHDFLDIVSARPVKFAVSMLRSERASATNRIREKELNICADVEAQRAEVRHAKWNFFKAALARDQMNIENVAGAVSVLAAKTHIKQVDWRREQASKGAKAIESFMTKHCRVAHIDRVEDLTRQFSDYLTYLARPQ